MAALTSNEFDIELAKNTTAGMLNRASAAMQALSDPSQKTVPNAYGRGGVTVPPQQGPATEGDGAVIALTGTPKTRPENAAQPLPQPQPASQQSSAQAKETPIPVGKYGWKGTSESVNGNPTIVLGTPGTDNSGVGSWQPGSARPGSAVATLASNQRMAPQTVVAGNAQQDQIQSPLEISHENWKNMSINRTDASQVSPAEKALSLIDNAPISRKLTPAQRDQVLATRAHNKAEIIAQLGGNLEVQKARNQGSLDEQTLRGANTMAIAKLEAADRATGHALDAQKVLGENAVNAARIGTENINQQKGKMEASALASAQLARDAYLKNPTPENELIYRGAIGKFEKEAQYGTVGKYDDQGMKIGEDLYNKQSGDLKRPGNGKAVAALPSDITKRKTGEPYLSPAGYMVVWDGKGLKPAQ
jgi:hypothetical protein